LELSEDGSRATRSSGVGHGVAFVGPLSLDKGSAYFEIEVSELEAKRSQTLALGVCASLPTVQSLRIERARDLGQGSYLLGYDLPKVFVNGSEFAKIDTKQWRPLKDLGAGDRIGLLVERSSMEMTIFLNGAKKASAVVSNAAGAKWPGELWGVVDVHGNVRSVRLLRSGCGTLATGPAEDVQEEQKAALKVEMPVESSDTAGVSRAVTTNFQEVANVAGLKLESAEMPKIAASSEAPDPLNKRLITEVASVEVPAGLKKRLRMLVHPCGCMVHLLGHNGQVVHVPRKGDFVIGRNPKCANLTLDSTVVPNMVSRRHAVIVSSDDSVMIVDCETVNGTYVNERRVGRETLRQGDGIIIGNPTQSPPEFRFTVSMPSSS